jgi:DNA invertase Pin-like site-specific DNA recombinase
MLDNLALGDMVIVTPIDRLAHLRPVRHRQADRGLSRRNSVHWRSRGPTPPTSTGRSMLAVLGGLADVERDLIRTRTADGRNRAKAQGQPMGRPPALTTPAQQKEATTRRAEGATLHELARSYGVGISTIRRATRAA